MESIEITISLTQPQAWQLAQFFKRVSFSEYRDNAGSDAEAYLMRDAGEIIRRALADHGYSPR
jgi:hypothetical protein